METERKISFAADLKANNIAVSIVSLNEYSKQILLLLEQLKEIITDAIPQIILNSCIETITKTSEPSSNGVLDEYIIFGERFLFLLNDITNYEEGVLCLFKQAAIYYLDIAKILKDDRVNKLSFSIADKLIDDDN